MSWEGLRRNGRHKTASTVLLALLTAGPGNAQVDGEQGDKGDDDDRAIDVIVVVGQSRARALQDTAASVNIVTAEVLEDQNITRAYDALSLVGNVSPPGRPNEGFSIRGINSEGVSGPVGGLPVSTLYIDGAPQSFQGARRGALSSWDVDQIEVFRGPQSTNQGRNALAGAVYIKTKDPTFEPEGALRVQYGSNEHRSFAGAISAPIVEEQLAFRLAAEWMSEDASIDVSGQPVKPFEREYYGIRGKLLAEPDRFPGLSLKLTAFIGEDEPGSRAVTGPDTDAERYDASASFNGIEQEGVEFESFVFDASYEFGDAWELVSITSFQTTESTELARGGDLDITAGDDDEEFTQQLKLVYTGAGFDGLLGIFHANSDVTSAFNAEGLFAVAPDYVPFVRQTTLGVVDRRTNAIFAEGTLDLAERWSVTVGARFEDESFENRSTTETFVDPDLFGLSDSTTINEDTDFDAFVPKASLTYRATENVNLSGSVAKGYRGGGVASAPIVGVRPYDPETVWTYELALRSTLLEGSLVLNANAFFTDWSDQQVSLSPIGNANSSLIVNAGESELYGIEADLIWKPVAGTTIVASAGYVNTEFTSFNAPEGFFVDGFTSDLVGNAFVRAPELTASAAIHWKSSSNGVFANASARFTDDRFQDAENTIGLESFWLVNGRVGWSTDRVSVYAFGNNLFDEKFLVFNFLERDNFGELGQDRTFGIGIEFMY